MEPVTPRDDALSVSSPRPAPAGRVVADDQGSSGVNDPPGPFAGGISGVAS